MLDLRNVALSILGVEGHCYGHLSGRSCYFHLPVACYTDPISEYLLGLATDIALESYVDDKTFSSEQI